MYYSIIKNIYFNWFSLFYSYFILCKKNMKKPTNTKTDLNQIYNIQEDVIMINYIKNNVKYTYCVPRTRLYIDCFDVYKEIKFSKTNKKMIKHKVLNATLILKNKQYTTNITDRLNSFIGDNCDHLKNNSLRISCLLTNNEKRYFDGIEIITDNFVELFFKRLNDKLTYDKFFTEKTKI